MHESPLPADHPETSSGMAWEERPLVYWLFVLVAAAGVIAFRYPWADDAYITFRYAENLRLLGELTYNPGERVLGTTAPLWGVLLAAARSEGLSYESASLLIGVVSFLLLPLVMSKLYTPRLTPLETGLLTISLVFLPLVHMTATSGMESGLYALVTVTALVADGSRRSTVVALLGAVAFGLRPDGILVPAAVCALRMWREPRYAASVFITWAVFVSPWLLWTTFYYGSPIPHSVIAKRMIHPSTFGESARALVERLTRSDLEVALNVAGLIGFSRWLRDDTGRVLLAWIGLYILGLWFSGVDPLFYWYAAPWWVWIVVLGVPGVLNWAETRLPRHQALRKTALAVLACLTIVQAITIRRVTLERFENMRVYREALPAITSRYQKGDSMYLCETGFLGFEFLDAYIYDSAGINSPAVLDLVRQQVNGETPKVIDRHALAMVRFQPTWIVSLRDICTMRDVEQEPWFRDSYELFLTAPAAVSGGLVVYRRREG